MITKYRNEFWEEKDRTKGVCSDHCSVKPKEKNRRSMKASMLSSGFLSNPDASPLLAGRMDACAKMAGDIDSDRELKNVQEHPT
jgi:hypothetical protein